MLGAACHSAGPRIQMPRYLNGSATLPIMLMLLNAKLAGAKMESPDGLVSLVLLLGGCLAEVGFLYTYRPAHDNNFVSFLLTTLQEILPAHTSHLLTLKFLAFISSW